MTEVALALKLLKTAEALRTRCKTTKEMAEMARPFFDEEIEYDDVAAQKYLTPEVASLLEELITKLEELPGW